jgi:hypothetical protein
MWGRSYPTRSAPHAIASAAKRSIEPEGRRVESELDHAPEGGVRVSLNEVQG